MMGEQVVAAKLSRVLTFFNGKSLSDYVQIRRFFHHVSLASSAVSSELPPRAKYYLLAFSPSLTSPDGTNRVFLKGWFRNGHLNSLDVSVQSLPFYVQHQQSEILQFRGLEGKRFMQVLKVLTANYPGTWVLSLRILTFTDCDFQRVSEETLHRFLTKALPYQLSGFSIILDSCQCNPEWSDSVLVRIASLKCLFVKFHRDSIRFVSDQFLQDQALRPGFQLQTCALDFCTEIGSKGLHALFQGWLKQAVSKRRNFFLSIKVRKEERMLELEEGIRFAIVSSLTPNGGNCLMGPGFWRFPQGDLILTHSEAFTSHSLIHSQADVHFQPSSTSAKLLFTFVFVRAKNEV